MTAPNPGPANRPTLAAWLRTQLEEDRAALHGSTSVGTWNAMSAQERGSSLVVHQPTGRVLARFEYPDDAAHAARWQPSTIAALIDAQLTVVGQAEVYAAYAAQTSRDPGSQGRMAEHAATLREVLRTLAQAYAHRPGYDQWQD